MKYKMSKGMKIMLTAFISVYLGNLVLDILSANSNINIWIARIIGLLLDFYWTFIALIISIPLNFFWIKNSKS